MSLREQFEKLVDRHPNYYKFWRYTINGGDNKGVAAHERWNSKTKNWYKNQIENELERREKERLERLTSKRVDNIRYKNRKIERLEEYKSLLKEANEKKNPNLMKAKTKAVDIENEILRLEVIIEQRKILDALIASAEEDELFSDKKTNLKELREERKKLNQVSDEAIKEKRLEKENKQFDDFKQLYRIVDVVSEPEGKGEVPIVLGIREVNKTPNIVKLENKRNNLFGLETTNIEFNFNKDIAYVNVMSAIANEIESFIQENKYLPEDFIQLTIVDTGQSRYSSLLLAQNFANVTTPLVQIKDFDAMSALSNYNYKNDSAKDMFITLTTVRVASGAGRSFMHFNDLPNTVKKGIIDIPNEDNYCLFHCLNYGIFYHLWNLEKNKGVKNGPYWKVLKKMRETKFMRKGKLNRLFELTKYTNLYKESYTMKDLTEFYDLAVENKHYLSKFRVKLVDANAQMKVTFTYPNTPDSMNKIPLMLFLYKNHYYFLKHDQYHCLFKNDHYKRYCHKCDKFANDIRKHVCGVVICKYCRGIHDPIKMWKKCDICSRRYMEGKCFENHLEFCYNKRECKQCGERYLTYATKDEKTGELEFPEFKKNGEPVHKCGFSKCDFCGLFSSNDHKCYMQKRDLNKPTNFNKIAFFDYETFCRKGDNKHVPIGIKLIYNDKTKQNRWFRNNDDFCAFILDEMKGFTLIAHNSRGYDAHFIHEYLIHNLSPNDESPSIIRSGGNIVSMTLRRRKIRIYDSLNHLTMRLSDFASKWGLDTTTYKKGYFPHMFTSDLYNSIDWKEGDQHPNYLRLPAIDYFEPNKCRSAKEKMKLIKWHLEKQLNQIWYKRRNDMKLEIKMPEQYDFQRDLHDYCEQDVKILQTVWNLYRKKLMSVTKSCINDCQTETDKKAMDKYYNEQKNKLTKLDYEKFKMIWKQFRNELIGEENVTNDMICNCERSTPLDPTSYITIASSALAYFKDRCLRDNEIGIFKNNKKMKESNKQYMWQQMIMDKEEGKFINNHVLKINGRKYYPDFYNPDTKTVYEFNGCYWHGCEKCFPNDRERFVNGKKMIHLYKNTIDRRNALVSAGFEVCMIWEHDYDKIAREFKNNNKDKFEDYEKSASINCGMRERECLAGGRTNCCKLYYKAKPDEDIKYIDVVSLYPYVQRTRSYPIGHPDKFTLTPEETTEKINNDTLFGIVKCVVRPPRNLYHPVLPSKINKKLCFTLCYTCCKKEKQGNCNHNGIKRDIAGTWTTAELRKAIEKGYEIITVQEIHHFENRSDDLFAKYIDFWYTMKYFAKVTKNTALKALAKLYINTLWGKLLENSSKKKTIYAKDMKTFMNTLLSKENKSVTIFPHGENMIEMEFLKIPEFTKDNYNNNPYIGSFVTSYARLVLYDALDKLNEKILYYDTDSVIYVQKKGTFDQDMKELDLKIGNTLGDWELEDVSEKSSIVEFTSTGPKSYAYIAKNPKYSTLKCKGHTLNLTNSIKLNFDTMKKIAKGEQDKTVVLYTRFVKNKNDSSISTTQIPKVFRKVYTKRYISSEANNIVDTKPYGF